MNRIQRKAEELLNKNQKAFVAYITAGHPTPESFLDIVISLERAGVDIVEVGVPFSDPVGDGPVIQSASLVALRNGTTPIKVLEWISKLRENSNIPILLFTYFNPILACGISNFIEQSAKSGVDGILCVDLPVEEAEDYTHKAREKGLATVFLIAPTSSEERIRKITRNCSGFVYYISRLGVTGEKQDVSQDISQRVQVIKKYTSLPVYVGFGISKPEHAKYVARVSDGVIVGSAFVRFLEEHKGDSMWKERFIDYVNSLVVGAKA
ncbi:MAG: tryptophan synthase subunit alpha [Candidatus Hydrogenedentes bacterium]|nr:tryptophan synthase subunit alpha [Candidatus Hydrogenedentota bacterium]